MFTWSLRPLHEATCDMDNWGPRHPPCGGTPMNECAAKGVATSQNTVQRKPACLYGNLDLRSLQSRDRSAR